RRLPRPRRHAPRVHLVRVGGTGARGVLPCTPGPPGDTRPPDSGYRIGELERVTIQRRKCAGTAAGRSLAGGAFGRRRRLHRRARERARPGLRLRQAARTVDGGLLLCRRSLLLAEDLVLRLAGEQPLELVLVDRLALDQ